MTTVAGYASIWLKYWWRRRRAYNVKEAAKFIANLNEDELVNVDAVQVIELPPEKVESISAEEMK